MKTLFICLFVFHFLASLCQAEPGPGDIYREFIWRTDGKWQRITYPEITKERAQKYLPNAVNHVEIFDLDQAIRAEVQVELLQSHYGTKGQALRLNENEWILIPPSEFIPGDAGDPNAKERDPSNWLSMRYPSVEIPLSHLRQGDNTLEFTCKPGFGLGKSWPQSLIYAAIVRIYYSEDKPHPTGSVEFSSPGEFSESLAKLAFAPNAGSASSVQRVDFIGKFEGFDWRGDGTYSRWHYNYQFGELKHHLGTSWIAPWTTTCDTSWIPNQTNPVAVMARVLDSNGLYTMTNSVEGLNLLRPSTFTVKLFRPYDIPSHWQTRVNRRHASKVLLPEDLSTLKEAKVLFATWNGHGSTAISINDTVLAGNIGLNHNLAYHELTVPISALRPGENEFSTFSTYENHGIEVQWPGFVLFARFDNSSKEKE